MSAFLGENQEQYKYIDSSNVLKMLRDFVRDKVIVEPDVVKYLEPLRGFVHQFRPLSIFSANYDTCIELFCSEHKLICRDGFDEAWNPKLFEDDGADIRLYKIHGSATWYRSDRGRYLKLPIRNAGSTVELITKERAESLILYPAQKYEYVEPLFELLVKMKESLSRCETLFVVGYSFRDDHIRRLIWDVARQKKDFHVVLISPDARLIYKQRLRYFDESIPSSLDGRVICLPFKFGKVLPSMLKEIFQNVRTARTQIAQLFSSELQGHVTHWKEALLPAALAGDYPNVWMLLNKIDVGQVSRQDLFKAIILGVVHAMGNKDQEYVSNLRGYYKEFWFSAIENTKFGIDGNAGSKYISVYPTNGLGSFVDVVVGMEYAIEVVVKRADWMLQNSSELICFLAELHKTKEAMSVWAKGIVKVSDYSGARKKTNTRKIHEYLDVIQEIDGTMHNGVDIAKSIWSEIKEIEKRVLLGCFAPAGS